MTTTHSNLNGLYLSSLGPQRKTKRVTKHARNENTFSYAQNKIVTMARGTVAIIHSILVRLSFASRYRLGRFSNFIRQCVALFAYAILNDFYFIGCVSGSDSRSTSVFIRKWALKNRQRRIFLHFIRINLSFPSCPRHLSLNAQRWMLPTKVFRLRERAMKSILDLRFGSFSSFK